MANRAIGLLETRGYVAALAGADAMVKAANVENRCSGAGWGRLGFGDRRR